MEWVVRFAQNEREYLVWNGRAAPCIFVYERGSASEATRFHSYEAAWQACDEYNNWLRHPLDPAASLIARVKAGSSRDANIIAARFTVSLECLRSAMQETARVLYPHSEMAR